MPSALKGTLLTLLLFVAVGPFVAWTVAVSLAVVDAGGPRTVSWSAWSDGLFLALVFGWIPAAASGIAYAFMCIAFPHRAGVAVVLGGILGVGATQLLVPGHGGALLFGLPSGASCAALAHAALAKRTQ